MSNKNLNFLRLPSVDTLRNYTNFTTVQTGFNPDIIKSLAQDAQVQTNDERGRQVVICFDEMQIKSNLVYHKATGKLIGFTEMGDINEEFRIFGSSLTESSTDLIDREFATHVLVYMVRGLFSSLLCPFGYFASNGMRSSQLYTCTLEAVRVLSAINFQVRALVSDGAAANRKFYEIMAIDNEKNFYWTWNPHSSPLKLYFFSDVPHLLKTTRNCFENSKWNKNVRNMHVI